MQEQARAATLSGLRAALPGHPLAPPGSSCRHPLLAQTRRGAWRKRGACAGAGGADYRGASGAATPCEEEKEGGASKRETRDARTFVSRNASAAAAGFIIVVCFLAMRRCRRLEPPVVALWSAEAGRRRRSRGARAPRAEAAAPEAIAQQDVAADERAKRRHAPCATALPGAVRTFLSS